MKRDNLLAIQTAKRTFLLDSETPEERQEWFEVLSMIKGRSDAEISELMSQARVNPKHADGTIDVDEVLSAGPTNSLEGDGPTFVVMTPERVYKVLSHDLACIHAPALTVFPCV